LQLIDVPTIEYEDYRQKIYFHHFTDIHMGAEGCDERQLDKDIDDVAAGRQRGEIHYACLGGDNINAIGVKDKRHDATAIAKRFKKWEGDDLFRRQVIAVAEKFEPIKDCIIFAGDGNHEQKIKTQGDYNPTSDLAQKLDVPYAGYACGFRLRLAPRNCTASAVVTGLWHHGRGAARTKGGKANMADQLQKVLRNADIIITGHGHEPIAMPSEDLDIARRGRLRLIARDKLVVIGASYLKTYPATEAAQTGGTYDPERVVVSDYGERAAYPPTVIGHVGFSVEFGRVGHERDNRVRLRMEDYR
jgi:hypothetical protein